MLATGGAGFIGSVVADQLRAHGEQVVITDDLSRGCREVVDDDVPFYQAAVGDAEAVTRTRRLSRTVRSSVGDGCHPFRRLLARCAMLRTLGSRR